MAALTVFAFFAAACGGANGEVSITPLPAAEGQVNPGLGPETRSLSSGPGYKGSPSWAPGGERIAFIVDGYVVDRGVDGEEPTRWTTKDFAAGEAEWTGDGSLAVLGGAGGEGPAAGRPRSVYRASGGGSLGVEKVATDVLAMSCGAERRDTILATEVGREESGIAVLRDGRMDRVYTSVVEGTVTGLSPSPEGGKVALAVRPPGSRSSNELRVFDLADGEDRRVSRLDGDLGVLGAPQWTGRGIYFVAGAPSARDGEPLYDLYRAGPEPGPPEPAPGVGEDFAAGGARVSPDGDRLAVVGRLNPKSPVNLYVLDLVTEDFGAVTTNEDMEIKTGPDDLAWSPSGASVAIVARSASTGEPEIRAAPAADLLDAFYNLYEVPIPDPSPPVTSR